MLKIPPSTLRRYVAQFSSHLSESAIKQRSRRFAEHDIAILARAREMLSEGNNPERVNELLSLVNSEEPSPDNTLALIPSLSQALSEALDTARALRAEVNHLNTQQAQTQERLSELAGRLDAIEREQSIPWYRKLTRRKP